MEFPKMIYRGGEHGADHRIVADQVEQDAAKADGFLQLGETARAPAPALASPSAPAADEKAQLIAALEAAGIEHKKSWGVEKLRAALEGKAE